MKKIILLVFCIQFISCDVTEINIADSVNLNRITGCNSYITKLIIEQKDITEEYTGYFIEDNLTFRIYYKNDFNYDEPVNMKIYLVNNVSDSACNKYLQAKNIKLITVNKEMKIYEADINKFAILKR